MMPEAWRAVVEVSARKDEPLPTEDRIIRKRGRPRKPRTFTEELRERVRAAITWCQCCDRPIGSVAAAAREAGVPHASLFQWLRESKPISGPSIDRLLTWLDKREGAS